MYHWDSTEHWIKALSSFYWLCMSIIYSCEIVWYFWKQGAAHSATLHFLHSNSVRERLNGLSAYSGFGHKTQFLWCFFRSPLSFAASVSGISEGKCLSVSRSGLGPSLLLTGGWRCILAAGCGPVISRISSASRSRNFRWDTDLLASSLRYRQQALKIHISNRWKKYFLYHFTAFLDRL